MVDSEKVKAGLKCCNMVHLDCDNCPYEQENDSNAARIGRKLYEVAGRKDTDLFDAYCMVILHHDALDLLEGGTKCG